MRDPYDIVGVKRGASFDDVKAAYRRACKVRHPDMGGSHEAMTELNTAYGFILNELKQGGSQEREQPREQRAEEPRTNQKAKEQTYRDIDEELEALRRAAEEREEELRRMRSTVWESGDRLDWARLTWDDLARFVRSLVRSGVKGLALLFAALVGVGSVLVEANFVSALILLGSGIGFAFSLALKSDKGGVLSAALLLFGVMTIWLPPVRDALVHYPLATISVLILLALIFKFTQALGTVGFLTGGVLALYVIVVVVDSTSHPTPPTTVAAPQQEPTPAPIQTPIQTPIAVSPAPRPAPAQPTAPSTPTQEPAPTPFEPRTLLASDGAILKFVSGVPYRLKVRNGRATFLRATQGTITLISGDGVAAACVDSADFPPESKPGPWREVDRVLRACEGDAIVTVRTSP